MTLMTVFLSASLTQASPIATGLADLIAECNSRLQPSEHFDKVYPDVYRFEPVLGSAEISGSFPTCGCPCSVTAIAYGVADDSYRYLGREEWPCDSKRGLAGSDWDRVLPAGLRQTILPDAEADAAPAVVYLDAELPRSGTDTTLRISLIPLGMELSCPGRVCDAISKGAAKVQIDRVSDLHDAMKLVPQLTKKGFTSDELEALARHGYPGLDETKQRLLTDTFEESYGLHRTDADEFLWYLGGAHIRWQWVQQLTTTEVPLRWNRDRGTFEIDTASVEPSKLVRFVDYLEAVGSYSPAC